MKWGYGWLKIFSNLMMTKLISFLLATNSSCLNAKQNISLLAITASLYPLLSKTLVLRWTRHFPWLLKWTPKCKSAWWQLYQISKIKSFLTADQLKTVTVSLVLSKLDQNNSLLHNVPDCLLAKLQRVQNSAARMLCSVSRHTEATPLLVSLHWLPIRKRITFKILLLVYKCLSGIGPLYLTELLSSYTNSESRQSLRSSSLDKLLIPLSNNKFGNRSFVVSAPGLWNILPVEIRCSTSVNSFKKSLKTFLFQL